MVYFHSSMSICNSVDQTPAPPIMANSMNSADLHPKPRNPRKPYTSPSSSCSNFTVCDGFLSAVIDVAILIAVITACGFLFFPYIRFITVKSVQLLMEFSCLAKEEILWNPIVYGSIALSISCAAISAWVVVLLCTTQRCGNPNCRGLKKAAEFDIQLETEDCVKSSSSANAGGKNKRGLFELPRDHHRELEAELKKMAPPSGRAVLVFRAKCGCSIGRLEVPGPKKQRKIKK